MAHAKQNVKNVLLDINVQAKDAKNVILVSLDHIKKV